MKFTEAQLEKAFAELLGQEGFPHHLGLTISRKPDEVLIEEDLRSFLFNQYAAQGITANEVNSILLQLKSLPASDLYESNKTFLRMLSDGIILKRIRPSQESRLTGAGCFVFTAQKQHISILGALKDLFGDNQIQLQLVRAAE